RDKPFENKSCDLARLVQLLQRSVTQRPRVLAAMAPLVERLVVGQLAKAAPLRFRDAEAFASLRFAREVLFRSLTNLVKVNQLAGRALDVSTVTFKHALERWTYPSFFFYSRYENVILLT